MNRGLIDKLAAERSLSEGEYITLLTTITPEDALFLAEKAQAVKEAIFGNCVYFRGLIEIGNICKNDCYYCGIRRSNENCRRYRLSAEQILACCKTGYELGFRTFVLQGGEDGYYTDERLCELLKEIKKKYLDCAITLSLGERSEESYRRLREAGADRYLLRHETIDKMHYGYLHPEEMSFEKRLACLLALRRCGYQVGCGFMVGSPEQRVEMLAKELKFLEEFRPEMCGIGPYIPHEDTPFADRSAGSVSMTCILLSCIRLILPEVLLPATTALASLSEDGRQQGILAGANVVMPNLSPRDVRNKYTLYNNKKYSGSESADQLKQLEALMHSVGHTLCPGRGDSPMIHQERK